MITTSSGQQVKVYEQEGRPWLSKLNEVAAKLRIALEVAKETMDLGYLSKDVSAHGIAD